MVPHVLIVDDAPAIREALELLFTLHDVQVRCASTPEEACAVVAQGGIAVVIQVMNFSSAATTGDEGAALFRALRKLQPNLAVIFWRLEILECRENPCQRNCCHVHWFSNVALMQHWPQTGNQ